MYFTLLHFSRNYYLVCNQLPKLNNGNWNVTYSSKGASASLICRIGFMPNVSTIALCNKDGEWLNTSVSCERG